MLSPDYQRVARAIEYLDASFPRHPSLAELAEHAGLSEFHFQRIFTRWAGISHKRFLQFQTVEYAKEALRKSRSVLDATYETGLSSTGRLHDLFIHAEAVTPGEYRSRGQGLEITWGIHESPYGDCFIAVTSRGVCNLTFVDGASQHHVVERLFSEWSGATIGEDYKRTGAVVERIFARDLGADSTQPLSVLLRGTNLQVRVWSALLRIPEGTLVSYEDVATAVGRPAAVRAVANAIGRNPVSYLIPCHRVIRKTGALGGYGGGLPRKRAMLGMEAGRTSAA
jgi:AraC family transcriptional regulator, regulatory protein of adaptative response / methylated-DNA-[protein]-cysteine methyltransferase